MNTIPAQAIKQRGIGAVDDLLANGPVHVITRNRPRYVVMDEERYEELLEAEREAALVRIRASLEQARAGNVRRYESTEELMAAIAAHPDDE